MTKSLAALCGAALLLLAAGPAAAETQQPAAKTEKAAKAGAKSEAPTPVDVTANEMEILDKEKKAIFRGAVDATRGTTNLKSDELTVTYSEVKQPDGSSKTDATDLDAKGNVVITTPKETITGDWAKYNPQTDMLTVGGNVKLVQGKTVLTGNELKADLKTSKTQMTGGRVKGSFVPQ
jgi:lipopolysaccharide export system protein LptA